MFRLPILLTLLLTGAAATAAAGEAVIRRIAQAEATSECIGDPRTPLCAVETFLACTTRRDMALCRKVGVKKIYFAKVRLDLEYVVRSLRILRPQDILPHLADTNWHKPGYADIRLDEHLCWHDEGPCGKLKWEAYGYWLRPVGDHWEVVSWSGPGWPD